MKMLRMQQILDMEYQKLIEQLKNHKDNIEQKCEEFKKYLNQFADENESLDELLNTLIETVIESIRTHSNDIRLINDYFTILHVCFQYRNFKVLRNFLPHDTKTLISVLDLLEVPKFSDICDIDYWKSRYCLLVWFSVVIMIPIDLNKFDNPNDLSKPKIIHRSYEICMKYMQCSDACDEIVPFLIAKFFTRKDVQQLYLSEFIAKLLADLESSHKNSKLMSLMILSALLKHLPRKISICFADKINAVYFETNSNFGNCKRLQKYACKMLQRLAIVSLPAASIAYRYKRENVHFIGSTAADSRSDCFVPESDQEKLLVLPENIEKIISELIEFLAIDHEEIRCAAAKGISIIFERLPIELIDDILDYILSLFNGNIGDPLWHGGCITLAFLSLNGLLPPKYLKDLLPVIKKALFFEVKLSSGSIGNLVRDSACFVCWSFARAFDPDDVHEFMTQLGPYLIVVALFDRNVNCRRAAAATFQENFGRLGIFSHGFEILPFLQFDLVSSRKNTYLNFAWIFEVTIVLKNARYIGAFEQYRTEIVNHLLNEKINHWDMEIRQLATESLFRIAHYLKTNEIRAIIFDRLLISIRREKLTDSLQGLLWTLGNFLLIYSIRAVGDSGNGFERSENELLVEGVGEILMIVKKTNRFLRNSLIKESFCYLIQFVAYSKLTLSGNQLLVEFVDFIKLSLAVDESKLTAAKALEALLFEYSDVQLQFRNSLLDFIINQTETEETKTGAFIVFENLPIFCLAEYFDRILDTLLKSMRITSATFRNFASRKQAISSMVCVVLTAIENFFDSNCANRCEKLTKCFDSLLICSRDYTKTPAGDVGRHVRQEAVIALDKTTCALNRKFSQFFVDNPKLFNSILASIGQQAVDKNDNIRMIAAKSFQKILYSIEWENESIRDLKSVIERNDNFDSLDEIYTKFVRLCLLKEFRSSIVIGLVGSMTSLSESLKLIASEKLIELIDRQSSYDLKLDILLQIVDVFAQNEKKARIFKSFPDFFICLFRSGVFDQMVCDHLSPLAENVLGVLLSPSLVGKIESISYLESLCVLLLSKKSRGKVVTHLLLQFDKGNLCTKRRIVNLLYETLVVHGEDFCQSDGDLLDSLVMRLSDADFDDPNFDMNGFRYDIERVFSD